MKSLAVKLFVLAMILFSAGSAFASYSSTYTITVDTSSLSNSTGYIYFQFLRDPNASLSTATAQIQDFATDGALGSKADGVNTGTGSSNSGRYVTGLLPETVTFGNNNQINDYNQAITFGSTISFQLVLTQNVLDPYFTNTFSMWLSQDAAGLIPLQTSSGELFEANIYGDGGSDVLVIDTTGTSVVPIPSTAWLMVPALLGLIGAKRKLS